jgi:hypothetical protein
MTLSGDLASGYGYSNGLTSRTPAQPRQILGVTDALLDSFENFFAAISDFLLTYVVVPLFVVLVASLGSILLDANDITTFA